MHGNKDLRCELEVTGAPQERRQGGVASIADGNQASEKRRINPGSPVRHFHMGLFSPDPSGSDAGGVCADGSKFCFAGQER